MLENHDKTSNERRIQDAPKMLHPTDPELLTNRTSRRGSANPFPEGGCAIQHAMGLASLLPECQLWRVHPTAKQNRPETPLRRYMQEVLYQSLFDV